MYGAIWGDIAGSALEGCSEIGMDFDMFTEISRFTDDTVMTIAVAETLLEDLDIVDRLRFWGNRYHRHGFGGRFRQWLKDDTRIPGNSWGNGSAMRVSPVGWIAPSLEAALELAEFTAKVTHNHPEAIKGTQAIAGSVWLLRNGEGKAAVKAFITENIGYDLSRSLDDIRPTYRFDVSCEGSVPQAITAFLESHDLEHAIRLGISLGGDTDTIGSMAGALGHAAYGAPDAATVAKIRSYLQPDLLEILDQFTERYGV